MANWYMNRKYSHVDPLVRAIKAQGYLVKAVIIYGIVKTKPVIAEDIYYRKNSINGVWFIAALSGMCIYHCFS